MLTSKLDTYFSPFPPAVLLYYVFIIKKTGLQQKSRFVSWFLPLGFISFRPYSVFFSAFKNLTTKSEGSRE